MSASRALSKFLLASGSFAAGGLVPDLLLGREFAKGSPRQNRFWPAPIEYYRLFSVSYCSAAEYEPAEEVKPLSSTVPSSSFSHVIRIEPTTGKVIFNRLDLTRCAALQILWQIWGC